MADDADRAQERDEILGQYLVPMSRKPVGPMPTGRCLNCAEQLAPGHRWCDAECREDWQYRQSRR